MTCGVITSECIHGVAPTASPSSTSTTAPGTRSRPATSRPQITVTTITSVATTYPSTDTPHLPADPRTHQG